MAYFRNHNIHLADCVRFIRIGEMKASAFQFYVTSGSIPSFDSFKCNITFRISFRSSACTPEDDSEDEIMVPEDKVDQLIYSSCAEEQTYITFNTFAFSRVPLSPTATQWNSRLGSEHPRYKTTALAILVHCQNDWDEAGHDVTFIPDFFAFSQDMFPELEELRMDSGIFIWNMIRSYSSWSVSVSVLAI
ncbi:hypothetical protein A0H81_01193 [Grifola frondosa]|uniref:Uncharacterized protein n=1 Tax=Grifola frondosa TaxID=5627 RepID=A0A1C7MRK1_GRIFR|nr:hypothetical protein A0H81_01193 [Grifola frondosa]